MPWCLPTDLVEPVADRVQEVLVGRDDRAVEIEFDDRLRLAECVDLGQCLASPKNRFVEKDINEFLSK